MGVPWVATRGTDLFQLSSRPEVLEMLGSIEYGEIKQDYGLISRIFPTATSIPIK